MLDRNLLDSMPLVVMSVAPDGTILFINRHAAEYFRADSDSLIGTSLYEHFPDRSGTMRQRIQQTVDAASVQTFETIFENRHGHDQRFDAIHCPAIDQEGRVFAVQIMAREVSDAPSPEPSDDNDDDLWGVASDQMSMTKRRIQGILESAAMVISIYDPDMTVRYLNRVLPDRTLEKVLGQTPLSWLTEQGKADFTRAFDRVLETSDIAECEVQGLSGHYWFVRLSALVYEGEVRQLLGCALDITEQKRLQQQLTRRQKLASLGTMARGIGHDFNNLLTIVMGNTNLVRRRVVSGLDLGMQLDEIDTACRRAADLCEEMMVYAGTGRPVADPGNLNRVIEEVLPLTRAMTNPKIELLIDTCAVPLVSINRVQLGQIFVNLMNNAADAIKDAGTIQVTLAPVEVRASLEEYLPEPPASGHYVRLQIQDSGPGIGETERQLIFDPFYSTKGNAGHGLGLPLVLGILRSYGAAIAVSSAENEGTTMTLLFPLYEDHADDEMPPKERPCPEGAVTVLVVDDEAAVRRIAVSLLEEAGYEVLAAEDGNAALLQLEEHGSRIQVVVMDVCMPGRDGHSTLRELRKTHLALPVILSSGVHIDLPPNDPFVSGLPKPYPPESLVELVANHVRRGSKSRANDS